MEFINVTSDQIDQDDLLFFVENNKITNITSQNFQTLFNPIWLQKINFGKYRIVDGFSITAQIFKNCEIKHLSARIFDSEFDLEKLWLLRMQKRLTEQNLVPIALLKSLSNLLKTLDKKAPSQDIVTLITQLGYPIKELNLNHLLDMLDTLKSHCTFCDLSTLTYREIYSLSRRKQDELAAFSKLFNELKLKGNKLQSMLQLMDELAKGYQLSPQVIVAREETQNILRECPVHLRYKTLKAYLSILRWPVLDKTQKKWQQSIKKFNLPGKFSISTDQLFESNEIDFCFKASNLSEFIKMLSTLKSYSTSAEFSQLFDFV